MARRKFKYGETDKNKFGETQATPRPTLTPTLKSPAAALRLVKPPLLAERHPSTAALNLSLTPPLSHPLPFAEFDQFIPQCSFP